MNSVLLLRRGGGPKAFAFIPVTYPAGSVCSCSMESRTLKAPDTSGSYVFAVPAAGTWTVSISDGSRTKSRSVSVSTANQIVDGSLNYEFVVYRQSPSDGSKGIWAEGYEMLGVSNSYNSSGFTINKDAYPAKVTYSGGHGIYIPAVDVGKYNTMEVTSGGGSAQWNIYGLSTDKRWYDGVSTNMAVYKDKRSSTYSKVTETFDISELSGEMYFKYYSYGGTDFSLYGLRFY